MAYWCPNAQDALIAWHNNFSTQAATNGTTLGLTAQMVAGVNSFGKGNFRALFGAVEREQALRGTL